VTLSDEPAANTPTSRDLFVSIVRTDTAERELGERTLMPVVDEGRRAGVPWLPMVGCVMSAVALGVLDLGHPARGP
jgi:hypothetical protein